MSAKSSSVIMRISVPVSVSSANRMEEEDLLRLEMLERAVDDKTVAAEETPAVRLFPMLYRVDEPSTCNTSCSPDDTTQDPATAVDESLLPRIISPSAVSESRGFMNLPLVSNDLLLPRLDRMLELFNITRALIPQPSLDASPPIPSSPSSSSMYSSSSSPNARRASS